MAVYRQAGASSATRYRKSRDLVALVELVCAAMCIVAVTTDAERRMQPTVADAVRSAIPWSEVEAALGGAILAQGVE